MTIDATGHNLAIDGRGVLGSRIFFINTPGTVTINGLILKNGNTQTNGTAADGSGNGAGIYDASPFSILQLGVAVPGGVGAGPDTIELNTAVNPGAASATGVNGGNGGGLYSNGVVTASNGTAFTANTTSKGNGGGIAMGSGAPSSGKNLTLNGALVNQNTAVVGGGIYENGAGTTVTLNSASTVTQNNATGSTTPAVAGNGGGIAAFFNYFGSGDTITGNQALNGGSGGGIYSQTGTVIDPLPHVINNLAHGDGGGIYAFSDVILTNAIVNGNIAIASNKDPIIPGGGGGGGIFSLVGLVKLFNTTVSNNQAMAIGDLHRRYSVNGGGIWSGTDVTMDATCSVTGNTANGNGGGIFALRSVTINGGTVSNNIAISSTFNTTTGAPVDGNGGGIWAGVDVTLNGGLVSGNTASLDGGGIFIANLLQSGSPTGSGNVDINSGSVISNNIAGFDGGGAWDVGGNVSIVNSSVTSNEANDDGGGLFVSGNATFGSLLIANSLINFNRALVEGGGVFVSLITPVTINGSTFDSNSADGNGGGMSSHGVLDVAITSTTFTNNNSISGSGGALSVIGPTSVYLLSDSFQGVDGSSVGGNTAEVSGGAVYLASVSGTTLTGTIFNCTFDGNLSLGGAHTGSDLFVDSNTVVDLNLSDFDDDGFVSANLGTDLIDTGNGFVSGGTPGSINSSGGNAVWDNSWVNITNFGFPGSGDVGDDGV